jgi:hypothetical protein
MTIIINVFQMAHPISTTEHKSTEKTGCSEVCLLSPAMQEAEIGSITTNTYGIQRIIRDYFKNLYPNKWENLEEINF